MRLLLALCILSLAGCATCVQQPVACSVGGAIIVGSAAASFRHDDQRGGPAMSSVAGPNCANGACR
jgi:hypothetical protein